MNKKYIFILLVVIVICFITFSTISLATTGFDVPSEFKTGNSDSRGSINLTDGTNSIYVFYYNDTDLNKHVDEYKRSVSNKNHEFEVSTFKVGDVLVNKVNVTDTLTTHYFFNHNELCIYLQYKF